MKPAPFQGSGVAMATPFAADGVDEARFRAQLEFQIQSGTDALIVLGTTGEPSTIPQDERDRITEIALESANGRVPVIVGTASNSTKTAIALSKRAEALGAQGLLIVTPYYNRPSQEGMIHHYLSIADQVGLPITLYNVPSRTGVDMKPETIQRLSQHENIVALKEANGNLVQLCEAIALCEGRMHIYSGNDDQVLPIMALGALGVISVAANVIPGAMHEMAMSYLQGDLARCRQLQLQWLPLIKLLFIEPSPQPLKAAMRMMGMDSGRLRLPLYEISPKNAQLLEAELRRMGLLSTD